MIGWRGVGAAMQEAMRSNRKRDQRRIRRWYEMRNPTAQGGVCAPASPYYEIVRR